MSEGTVEQRIVRMPDFAPGDWLNTGGPIDKAQLRDSVTLVDFWDYSCSICLRTFPYLRLWHERYAEHGLRIIGVHTPEFKFGRIKSQVESAVTEHRLPYPILLDNQYETWSRFANHAWPTRHVVDGEGYIRLRQQGKGQYREIERAIQNLLSRLNPRLSLPDLLPPLRAEDEPGAACYPKTPELYTGYQGGGLFGGALGNPEGYVPQNPMFYELPEAMEEGQFYLEGIWRSWPESIAYAGRHGARVVLLYKGTEANAVLAPSADNVEIALSMPPTDAEPIVLVRQDGAYLTDINAGEDIEFTDRGASTLRVTRPRMYRIVNNPRYGTHKLELTFCAHGLSLYSFSFSACAIDR